VPDPVEVKNENDRVKNMVDLFKIVSEECRHTADIIWRFAIAIITFQSAAVALAVSHPSSYTALTLGLAGYVARSFSIMLLRQAVIRGVYLDRLQVAESQLEPIYRGCFKRIPEASIHDYKSTDLAKFLLGASCLMMFVSVAWVLCDFVCRTSVHGLVVGTVATQL
jgi:hypothetical protein